MAELYEQLQQKLDDMGSGFPKSAKGLDIKILKQIFTPGEAEMFLRLSPILTTPEDVAAFFELDPAETAELLETMAGKGQLFRLRRGDAVKYAAVPFVVGVYEFQLNRLTPELSADMEAYYEEVFGKEIQAHGTPIMRTIPIDKGFVPEFPVAPYEDVLGILESQKKIAVAPCICRSMADVNDRGCDKPKEACFLFGAHAEYYVDNGMGRYIDLEEAKKIVAGNVEAGLVMQPFNSQKVGGMCSCCGCCCGVLRSLKKQPSPAEAVKEQLLCGSGGGGLYRLRDLRGALSDGGHRGGRCGGHRPGPLYRLRPVRPHLPHRSDAAGEKGRRRSVHAAGRRCQHLPGDHGRPGKEHVLARETLQEGDRVRRIPV
jgi:electron transport complex protein RnfB